MGYIPALLSDGWVTEEANPASGTPVHCKTCSPERIERERRPGVQVDDFLLTKEDLIGPDPSQVLPRSR